MHRYLFFFLLNFKDNLKYNLEENPLIKEWELLSWQVILKVELGWEQLNWEIIENRRWIKDTASRNAELLHNQSQWVKNAHS